MQLASSRQVTTGIVVNKKINVTKRYHDEVRAMCHSLFTTGKCHHFSDKRPASMEALQGKLEFLLAAKTFETGLESLSDLEKISYSPGGEEIPSHYKLMRRFLASAQFHSRERPLLICEGKTDNTYIRCAIEGLSKGHPSLQQTKDGSGDAQNALSFFRHSERHAKYLSISGGTGELHKFVGRYDELVKGFHAGGQTQPVIVVVDNDSAAKPMWSVVRDKTGAKKVDGSEPFYHVTRNLFVVPIPIPVGKSASIEDLFDKATLATINKGKKFNPQIKSHQTKNHYGKEIFAKWVIEANAKNIDFSGFSPLLGRIEDALKVSLTPSNT
jgi:hypothetical protein